MGTRADYYVGKNEKAEWIGSVAWDGDEVDRSIRAAKTEGQYRAAVQRFLESRDDATFPKDGWPWPWEDSGTSDCAFTFDGKRFRAFKGPYPNMKSQQRVTLGPRSGLLIIGG